MKKLSFNISARTAKLIGQENFANAEGAVIELVKNCYDADASVCVVLFKDNSLYIIDDGDGMTEKIIEDHWMTIGTDHKNNNEPTLTKLRIKTGAKGIGRFALDRLGIDCEMSTQADSMKPIKWTVNWKLFDGPGAKLTDIQASIEDIDNFKIKSKVKNLLDFIVLPDDFFKNHFIKNTGTIVKISNLRDQWDEDNINQVFHNLEQLIPPLENNTFSVYLYSQKLPKSFGSVKPDPFEDYDYKLVADIKKNGKVDITIWRNELDLAGLKKKDFFNRSRLTDKRYSLEAFKNKHFQLETTLKELLPTNKKDDEQDNLRKLGPFNFSFFFMKRGGPSEKDEMQPIKYPYRQVNYSNRSGLLSKYGGIKIFRDNFRVRPYGEAKSISFDWLELGDRAARSPTITGVGYKVRPTQVYGVVNISKVKNPVFQDKSNREGLQENDVFIIFKQVIVAIINKFEIDRSSIMAALDKIRKEDDRAAEAVDTVADDISAYKSNNTTTQPKPSSDSNNASELEQELSSSPGSVPSTGKQDEADRIIDKSEIAIEALKQEISDLRTEQQLYRVLASTGLTVASFAHELKNIKGKLVSRADYLKAVLDKLLSNIDLSHLPKYKNPFIMVDDIRKEDVRITQWLDFSLSVLRKDKRTRTKIDMLGYASELQRSWSVALSEKKIKLDVKSSGLQSSFFRGFEIDLDTIFNNLITNSIEAFTRPSSIIERDIKLSFPFAPDGIVIVYEDSGPGLNPEISDIEQIFEPFFTTKRNSRTGEVVGTGLGMWLIKSTVKEYNGTIQVSAKRPGFKITINLPTSAKS